jgi:hypothetical protein
MIVFNLMCEQQHRFEGWFDSGDDFSAQRQAGQIECPMCASKLVRKVPAGSYVKTAAAEQPAATNQAQFETLRRRVIEYIYSQTEDVGAGFAEAARKMHYQETQARGIRGKATSKQVEELAEEGIDVFALPPEFRLPDKLH